MNERTNGRTDGTDDDKQNDGDETTTTALFIVQVEKKPSNPC